MRTAIKHILLASTLLAGLTVASCTDENYMVYDSTANGIYFNHDTLNYSFSVMPVDTLTHVIEIPVMTMGTMSQADREFNYKIEYAMPDSAVLSKIYQPVPADSTFVWAKEGEQFTLAGKVIIPGGKTNGVIPITIHRPALKGDYRQGYTRYQIIVRLQENDNFTPTLSEADQVRIVEFDNSIEQPEWYSAHGTKVWYESQFGVWHPYKFIKMVEYFHDLKTTVPETYVKMVRLYGENLEHVPYGDFFNYRTIMRKYVFQRMYEHFNDPEARVKINEMYGDTFPYDFPNPFSVDD